MRVWLNVFFIQEHHQSDFTIFNQAERQACLSATEILTLKFFHTINYLHCTQNSDTKSVHYGSIQITLPLLYRPARSKFKSIQIALLAGGGWVSGTIQTLKQSPAIVKWLDRGVSVLCLPLCILHSWCPSKYIDHCAFTALTTDTRFL